MNNKGPNKNIAAGLHKRFAGAKAGVVRRNSKTSPWGAVITVNGKQVWLGARRLKREAAELRLAAEEKYWGVAK